MRQHQSIGHLPHQLENGTLDQILVTLILEALCPLNFPASYHGSGCFEIHPLVPSKDQRKEGWFSIGVSWFSLKWTIGLQELVGAGRSVRQPEWVF